MKQHHHEQAPVKMIAMISKLRMIWGGGGRGNTEQVILFWKNEFINKEKKRAQFSEVNKFNSSLDAVN